MSDAPKPSATVVLLRDADPGLETLLLQRAGRADKPGPWVFPGGRVEAGDHEPNASDELHVFRRAACRETEEESGIRLLEESLHTIARWITPEIAPKRFDTWFFAAHLPHDVPVRVDGQEIVASQWIRPEGALAGHERGDLNLAPPQFVTVSWLLEFGDAASAVRTLNARPLIEFRPRITRHEGGAVMLYPGDAGYEASDPARSGARHRVIALAEGRYRYERDHDERDAR